MVNVEVALVTFVIRRIDIGNRTIAIPLKVGDVRILRHNAVNYAKHIILHFRIRDVEHQLITIVVSVTIRLLNYPVGMLFKEFTLRIHHFRFYPYTKLHACGFSITYQTRNAIGQLAMCYIPIAQSSMIILARIFVSKPTIVEQEHVYT